MIAFSSHISRTSRQRGMTLIEILVAIVVLSIGLLGLAGLQLKGLQVSQGSTYRSQAALLAEDMADRIRADASNVNAYVGSTTPTGATLASINEWTNQVKMLPGGSATITAPAGGSSNNLMTITVTWLDQRAQGGAGQTVTAPGSFALTTELWN
jgi:type IV pilus assembly protein PilV